MSKPHFIGRNFELFIEDSGTGEFVPIREVRPTAKPGPIICVPTPCKGGFEYVPDWWGITHFG